MTREPWQITRDMFLSLEEVARLSAHLDQQEQQAEHDKKRQAIVDRVIVESLLFSGARNSEFCRLALVDVDLSSCRPTFHIRGTPREDRTVYIPSTLADLLRRYVADTRPECLTTGISRRDGKQPFVLNERGRRYDRTALYRRVVRILSEAGLGDRASVQLLRHTYGYLAYLRTGCNLLFVQRQLGHAHPMVTSVYAQFVDESYADLADAVAGVNRSSSRATRLRKSRISTIERS